MRKRLDLDWLVELFDCDISSPDHADAFYPGRRPLRQRRGPSSRDGVFRSHAAFPRSKVSCPQYCFYGHPDGSELLVEQSVETPHPTNRLETKLYPHHSILMRKII